MKPCGNTVSATGDTDEIGNGAVGSALIQRALPVRPLDFDRNDAVSVRSHYVDRLSHIGNFSAYSIAAMPTKQRDNAADHFGFRSYGAILGVKSLHSHPPFRFCTPDFAAPSKPRP